MLIGKVKRYMSEKITSVEDEILSYQEGIVQILSGTDIFVPLAIEDPIAVHFTQHAGVGTAQSPLVDFDDVKTVVDLPAHAGGVVYSEGNIVKATETDNVEAAYLCIEEHTSTAGPDFDADLINWEKLSHTNFLLVTVDSGPCKFNYKVDGYKVN